MNAKVLIAAPMKTIVPIIKVVGDACNLRCSYCFYHNREQSQIRVLGEDLLERFIFQYMDIFPGHIVFNWHGGEPLLAGIDFFQKVIKLQRIACDGHQIRNTIQTNGTLITDEWASFFKKHNFGVGVSIDGDQVSHDQFRINRGGTNTFNAVVRGIRILIVHGINPGIIQTITKSTVTRVGENFNFFVNVLKLENIGVNVFLDLSRLNTDMMDESLTNEDLITFLKTYIDLWLAQNDPQLVVREVENFLYGIFGKKTTTCTHNGNCSGFVCLDWDGTVYPCDRLSSQEVLAFGNLRDKSLLEILNSPKRERFVCKVNTVHTDCRECTWFSACHNGCTIHRVGDLDGKYYYCEARKVIFEYLQDRLPELG